MQLKRHYNTPEGWVRQVDPKTGNCINPPPLDHIECRHTGTSAEQHFSDNLVMGALQEGWMSIKDGMLTLHCKPEPLRYKIVRVPGKYPVAKKTDADPGYEVIHYYDCVLDPAQHERFCLKKGDRRG